MRVAAQTVNPRDSESVAWYHTHLSTELMNTGSLAEVREREVDKALHAFPNYHLALAAKARARLAAGDKNSAVEFYRRAQERVPLPDHCHRSGRFIHSPWLFWMRRSASMTWSNFIERAGTAMSQTTRESWHYSGLITISDWMKL